MGGVTAEAKSFCCGAYASPKLQHQESFKYVGGSIYVPRQEEERLTEDVIFKSRIKEAIRRLGHMDDMPLTWEQRERLVEQGVCSAMTFAQGCRRFPEDREMKKLHKDLRIAIKRGIALPRNLAMNVEVFHTLLSRGYRSDPLQAADYEALVNIWRATKEPELRTQMKEVFDMDIAGLDGPA